ncbi:hypothetical protein SDRG_10942 [Saprolegnia diclina VS20]|uniref:AT hook domain-containing protein n=1 Tax=Saprolegnia diclina (strain VS20) TaxID=1156394 RepID=T0QCR1_SAPDV|nr:hypothetical protein SDRG_10942 [Saprolegnia diclina VS20]EQC31340.1 hypothetical protein SDRG_10942 [Saprolegnia diclina VS20]|eukprot:XP_008615181.1 hypothetical protein SDRG_10942 [Saprolegnia diclina VS20]
MTQLDASTAVVLDAAAPAPADGRVVYIDCSQNDGSQEDDAQRQDGHAHDGEADDPEMAANVPATEEVDDDQRQAQEAPVDSSFQGDVRDSFARDDEEEAASRSRNQDVAAGAPARDDGTVDEPEVTEPSDVAQDVVEIDQRQAPDASIDRSPHDSVEDDLAHEEGAATATCSQDIAVGVAAQGNITVQEPVVKRGRGRPRKVIPEASAMVAEEPTLKRGRGRPRKAVTEAPETDEEPAPKRGPGRPRKDATQPPATVATYEDHRRSERMIQFVDHNRAEAQEATPTVRRKVGRPHKNASATTATTTQLLERKSRSKKAVQRYEHDDTHDNELPCEMSNVDGHESNRSGSEYEASDDDASDGEDAAPSSVLPSHGKRPRGRPRKYPKKPENIPKNPRGRPRKHPQTQPSQAPAKRGRPFKIARVNPTLESLAPGDGSLQTGAEPNDASPMAATPGMTSEDYVAGYQLEI